VAQSLGDSYTGLFSFEAATEADLAVRVLRKAVGGGGKTAPTKRPAASRAAKAPKPAKRKAGASGR